MSGPSSSHKEQSSSSSANASAPPDENVLMPPSYESLFPDYPDAGPAVSPVNSNLRHHPPYTPYPIQQYVILPEGASMIGHHQATIAVHPKHPTDNRCITPAAATPLIYTGSCPLCRVGFLEEDYPCGAICCAIFFFPIGLLCCWALRQKRCNNCDYVIE